MHGLHRVHNAGGAILVAPACGVGGLSAGWVGHGGEFFTGAVKNATRAGE
jgi:hypothetical protein